MKSYLRKTPMQMRLEAERGSGIRRSEPPREVSSAKLPHQHSEDAAELDAAAEWLAHLSAGRLEVR